MWQYIKNNKWTLLAIAAVVILTAMVFALIMTNPPLLFAVAALPGVGTTLASIVFATPSIPAAAGIVAGFTAAFAVGAISLLTGLGYGIKGLMGLFKKQGKHPVSRDTFMAVKIEGNSNPERGTDITNGQNPLSSSSQTAEQKITMQSFAPLTQEAKEAQKGFSADTTPGVTDEQNGDDVRVIPQGFVQADNSWGVEGAQEAMDTFVAANDDEGPVMNRGNVSMFRPVRTPPPVPADVVALELS